MKFYHQLLTFILSIFFILILSSASFAHGLLPENPWSIPIGLETSGISEEAFYQIIKEAEEIYEKIVDEKNAELIIYKSWGSNTVNAYADRSDDGRKWELIFYGGLARHPQMTEDGFRLTICHELGHHFGGAPKKPGNTWSSAEGEADFYGSLKCLKKWWQNQDLNQWYKETQIPEIVESKCRQAYAEKHSQLLCMRSSLAGRSVAMVMKEIEWESLEPRFETPDPKIANNTLLGHPSPQCRLDTYFQGSLCNVNSRDDLDDDNVRIGVCPQNAELGFRPLCWFNPKFH